MGTEITKSDLLNSLIYVTIILFVLSVIVEKVTQLVRLYPQKCKWIAISGIAIFYALTIYSYATGHTANDLKLPDFISLVLTNTAFLIIFVINLSTVKEKQNLVGRLAKKYALLENIEKGSPDSNENKERDITLLSFIIGFIVAYLFNAHLIQIFIDPSTKLGWGDVKPFIGESLRFNKNFFGFDAYSAMGFALTGFFLCFGSKFFHDILDTLFQVKELKRKLNDKETFQVSSIIEFDKQLAMSDKDMVKVTFDKQIESLMKMEGILGVSCGTFILSGSSVYGIKIYTNKENLLVPALAYAMPNGNSRTIPVQVIKQETIAKTCVQVAPSDNMHNKTINSIGSLCFSVKDKDDASSKYFLTCYHVVKGDNHSWNYFSQLYSDQDKATIQNNIIANIARGVRNKEMDAALIRRDLQLAFNDSVPLFNVKIKKTRPVYYDDENNTTVHVYGAKTRQKMTGIISAVGARHKIDFQDGTPPFEMMNLFEIQNNNTTIVSQGDSGALLFTDDGEALGMVMATTEHTTLAIPINTILSHWNIELDI